jgi:hypothetical protein
MYDHYANDTSPSMETGEQTAPEIEDIGPDAETSFALDTSQQIQDGVQQLSQIEGLNPQNWAALDSSSRLEVLQNVEDRMATIQGRPAIEITPAELSPGTYGYYDGQCITINAADLDNNQMQVQEFVDTIVHEGRHAYQDYAIKNPGAVSDPAVVVAWAENFQPGNYLTAEEYGQEAYLDQPVEADAWNYAGLVTSALFGEPGEGKQNG